MKYFRLFTTFCLLVSFYPVYGHGGEKQVSDQKISQEKSVLHKETVSPGLSLIQRIFIPKLTQFENKLTTFLVQEAVRPMYEILPAKVIASPSGYAQINVQQASRIVADPAYPMPGTGDKVEAHQVIAVVEPLVTSVDFTDKKTELYKIEGEISQLERQVKRLVSLGEYSPRVKLEDARTDLEKAQKQKTQILATGLGRELVRAPISGILSDSHILPGQVVQPGQPVAEIINTSSLRIEAYTYDYVLADTIKSAYLKSLSNAEKTYLLDLVGLSPKVGENDQARHILFIPKEAPQEFLIGMVVDVVVNRPSMAKKIIIPQKSLFKSGKNYSVFILSEPELVLARPVQVGLFFDDNVEILEGLKLGERVIGSIESLKNSVTNKNRG